MFKNKPIVTIICILAIAASLFSIYSRFNGRPSVKTGPYKVIGQTMADETIKAIGESGTIVVLALEKGNYDIPSLDTEWNAFKNRLASRSRIKIAAVHKLRLAALSFVGIDARQFIEPSVGMSPDDFDRAVAASPEAKAVVSFVGLPPLSKEEIDGLDKTGTKILALSSRDPWLSELFQKKAISFAIIPRATVSPKKKSFEDTYEILTPENYSRALAAK